MRIALAGATGVIGERLVPLLVAAGHDVLGLTRSPERIAGLEQAGAAGRVVDVYDRDELIAAVTAGQTFEVIQGEAPIGDAVGAD